MSVQAKSEGSRQQSLEKELFFYYERSAEVQCCRDEDKEETGGVSLCTSLSGFRPLTRFIVIVQGGELDL